MKIKIRLNLSKKKEIKNMLGLYARPVRPSAAVSEQDPDFLARDKGMCRVMPPMKRMVL